jgi:hypothetical protein
MSYELFEKSVRDFLPYLLKVSLARFHAPLGSALSSTLRVFSSAPDLCPSYGPEPRKGLTTVTPP